MNYSIAWEGHDAGSPVGNSSLPLTVTVQYLCLALQKHSFLLPNIETKTFGTMTLMTSWELISKLLYFMEVEDKKANNIT
jgi:hypothetical protein